MVNIDCLRILVFILMFVIHTLNISLFRKCVEMKTQANRKKPKGIKKFAFIPEFI